VNTSPIVAPLQSSANIRTDVRLETLTGATVEELAIIVNRPRAPVLRQVMRWGVRRGYAAPVDEAPPSLKRHLFITGGDAGAMR
jgi:hypothetical protein